MRTLTTIKKAGCKKFLHLSMFSLLTLISLDLLAGTTAYRGPASAVPDEEVLTAPIEQKVLIQSLLIEDDAGVLKGLRSTLESYQQTENYAKIWHLESTGLYQTPAISDRQRLIVRSIPKYADKRLAGEIKNAEEGSAMQSVGKAEQALRPNTTVAVSNSVAVKFKLNVLQGNMVMEVKNPVAQTSVMLTSNSKIHVMTVKEFKELGLSAGADFRISEGESVIYADQMLSKNLKARVSTNQTDHKNTFANDADKRRELYFKMQ